MCGHSELDRELCHRGHHRIGTASVDVADARGAPFLEEPPQRHGDPTALAARPIFGHRQIGAATRRSKLREALCVSEIESAATTVDEVEGSTFPRQSLRQQQERRRTDTPRDQDGTTIASAVEAATQWAEHPELITFAAGSKSSSADADDLAVNLERHATFAPRNGQHREGPTQIGLECRGRLHHHELTGLEIRIVAIDLQREGEQRKRMQQPVGNGRAAIHGSQGLHGRRTVADRLVRVAADRLSSRSVAIPAPSACNTCPVGSLHSSSRTAPVPATSGWSKGLQRAAALTSGSLPGLLGGAQLAGLLFFLNPHWRTDFGPWLRTVMLYATLLGLSTLLLQLPFYWRHPQRAWRALPWTLVGVFVAFGALHWWHASALGLYLPPGINRRLIKAGALLLAGGLAGFYIALLHTMQTRPYRLRARLSMLLLCLLAVYVVVERREAYRPAAVETPRPALVRPSSEDQRLVFVGISALTLDVILPLAEQGRLPFFAQVVGSGAVARVETLSPTRHERLWWTAMTGVLPYRLADAGARRYAAGFIEPGEVFLELPAGIGFTHWGVPGGALPSSRQAPPYPPLWDVASRVGLRAAEQGFTATTPPPQPLSAGAANPDSGAGSSAPSVSDYPQEGGNFASAQGSLAAATGEETPPTLVATNARRLLLGDGARLTEPDWANSALIDLARVEAVIRGLRESRVVGLEAAPQAVFVRLDGLSDLSRQTYGAFVRVELEGRRGEDLERAAALLETYYLFLDRLLADLWATTQRSSDDQRRVSLVVASPSGVQERSSLWRPWSSVWPRIQFEGRLTGQPDGALLMFGHGVRKSSLRVRLTDVAPTVAYLLGLPVARDLDGIVRAELFEPSFLSEQPLRFVPSYGTVARPAGVRTSVGLLPDRPTLP